MRTLASASEPTACERTIRTELIEAAIFAAAILVLLLVLRAVI
jgi:hypothetical protein